MTEEQRIKYREYNRIWREKNREKKKEYSRKTYQKNREKILEQSKLYREKNAEKRRESSRNRYQQKKEMLLEQCRLYRENNPKKRREILKKSNLKNIHKKREWERNYRKTNPLYRLRKNLSNSIILSLKKGNYTKKSGTKEIIGLEFQSLKEYIEGLWEPWMSWDNYGLYKIDTFNYGWDIDHIIPTSTAKTEEEVLKLNHYTNLKPLCSKVNRHIKRDKLQQTL